MIRSLLRQAAGLLAGATLALSFVAAPAQGATITFQDDNCSDFAVGGTTGARTLTCLVLVAPVCNPTAPSTGTFGSPVTITANCSNQPLAGTYVWTGGGCALSSGSTCSDTQAGPTPPSVTYTVKASNNVGQGSAGSVVVAWSTAPPPTPTGCSIAFTTGSANLPNAGGAIAMTATCANTSGSTTWSWTKNGAPFGTTTATLIDSFPPGGSTATTTRYVVTATNGGSPGTATQDVTVAGTSVPPPTGGITCPGYTIRTVDLTIPAVSGTGNTYPAPMSPGEVLIGRVRTSATPDTQVILGYIYNAGAAIRRTFTLSTIACNFNKNDPGVVAFTSTKSVSWTVSIGVPPPLGGLQLQPDTTYYFIVQGRDSDGVTTCTPSTYCSGVFSADNSP